jgi:hypothetical protein
MAFSNCGSRTFVPLSWRIFFADLLMAKWLVPAFLCFAFPVADSRNRFRVDL